VSKGATLTHRNIVANILQADEWFLDTDPGKELVVTALPLYHIFALTVNCLLMFHIGANNLLITNPRDIPGFIKELKKVKMTVFTAVNTLFVGLLNNPEFRKVDFSRLKYTIGGGMAVQSFAEGYGLSETSPLVTCNPLDGTARKGTIGLPAPSTVVKVMDDDGKEVPVGERGEICVEGPQVMKGYWQRPAETEKVFFGSFFRTGDIGIMDNEGLIASHDKVLEVAVIGVPDERTTEAVKAYIVKKDDSLTEAEIMEYCKENLTNYKRPKYIEFKDELPKSNVGKILRRKLREA